MNSRHLQWIPTRVEMRRIAHPPAARDFYNHVYYRVSDAPRSESREQAEYIRQQHELGAQLFWCVPNRGFVRIHTHLDALGQRILGQSETKSEFPMPVVNMEWSFSDTSQQLYSGLIRDVRFRRHDTVGLVVLYPYRRIQ